MFIPYHDKIIERRNAVLVDWPAFLEKPPPHLVAEVIERDGTELHDQFVAWAPGAAVASNGLLKAAQYRRGSRRPPGWCPRNPDVFSKRVGGNLLWVRGCGEFWIIEREIDEVLVLKHGSLPIFTRTYQAAMRLAGYCHPHPPEGLYWCVSTPDGINYC
jgi:hypothetical protein